MCVMSRPSTDLEHVCCAPVQECVHAYMRKRRKTEAKEKAEELESTRLRVATDNLAVLAQARSPHLLLGV